MPIVKFSRDEFVTLGNMASIFSNIYNTIFPHFGELPNYDGFGIKFFSSQLRDCLMFGSNNTIIEWKSPQFKLNPKYHVEAKSRAAKSNTAGKSPMGNQTSADTYLIPYMNISTDIFVVANLDCFGIISGKSFIFFGIIYPNGTSTPYSYVYASNVRSAPNVDSRLISINPYQFIFMCYPRDTENFHEKDSHNMFINALPTKGEISMSLIIGYNKAGHPIEAPFAYTVEIINFDTCRLSNDLSLYKSDDTANLDLKSLASLYPDDISLLNYNRTGHPRSVNTLNDITNLKCLDIFVRDADSLDLYGFFAHINHLASCSSYHFSNWFTTKIDYPTTGSKWFCFVINQYIVSSEDSNKARALPYHGLGVLDDVLVYRSATDIDSISYVLEDGNINRIPFTCSATLPSNIGGVDINNKINKNCNYKNGIPTGSIIITRHSLYYTIFYGDEGNVFSKNFTKKDLIDASNNNRELAIIDDGKFSLIVSFYANMWNVLVPTVCNCTIFNIYSPFYRVEGGETDVVSVIQ